MRNKLDPAQQPDHDKLLVETLVAAFFNEGSEDGYSYFSGLLARDNVGLHVIKDSNGNLINVALWNLYSWQGIRNQLYLKPIYGADSQLEYIALSRLEDLICDKINVVPTNFVAELSYNLVTNEHRGKGYGRVAWESRINKIQAQITNPIVFTLALSQYAGVDMGKKVLEVLLSHEREKQGVAPEGQVKVIGALLELDVLAFRLGVQNLEIGMNCGSSATVHLATQSGFQFIGFSRNFSLFLSSNTSM